MERKHETVEQYDIAVIGGGAAGLAAALLLRRAHRTTAVIDDGHPRNAPAEHSHGYLTRDGESPSLLLQRGREEVSGYGAEFIDSTVLRIDSDRTLQLADGRLLRADRVLVATGVEDVLPDIPGLSEGWGSDVLHCPYCHAYEAGQGPFVVLGTHPGALHQAILLTQWTDDVILAVGTLELDDRDRAALHRRGVTVAEGRIERLDYAADGLSGVWVAGKLVPATKVFVFPVPRPRDAFLEGLPIARTPMGFLESDADGRTSVPWLYVAGNASDPRWQLLPAAGDGARVAFMLNNAWVREEAYDEAVGALERI
jgi:thioredoxin reductase